MLVVILWLFLDVSGAMDEVQVDLLTPGYGEACGYMSCAPLQDDAINIHIVPHTYANLAGVNHFDQIYSGQYGFNVTSELNMKKILDAVISELWANPERKFTLSDMPFLFKWWTQRDGTVHRMVYQLLRQGRLYLVGGGLSMPDEASTSYHAIIDSFTYSLRKLNSSFLECGRPLVAWQSLAYGHSREFASLMAQMGFDGLFVNPISYDDEVARSHRQALEVLWRGSDDLGAATDIFTHKLFDGFESPPGFCFASNCNDPLIVSSDSVFSNVDERSDIFTHKLFDGFESPPGFSSASNCNDPLIVSSDSVFSNVDERVDLFIDAMLHRQLPHYNTTNLMVVMGTRLGYHDAGMWFANIEKLITFVNRRARKGGRRLHLMYSTPACYLRAVHGSNIALEPKQDDFLPFAYDRNTYLAGMYTSRPTLKWMVREGHLYLQMAKQMQVLARVQRSADDERVDEFKWIMGIMQDHNIMSGHITEEVKSYYVKILDRSIQASTLVLKRGFNKLRQDNPTTLYYRCNFNISSCLNTNMKPTFVMIYNPLGWPVSIPVRLPTWDIEYTVHHPNGTKVPYAMMKLPDPVVELPARGRYKVDHELVFIAEDIPPVGYRSYYVHPNNIRLKRSIRNTMRSKYENKFRSRKPMRRPHGMKRSKMFHRDFSIADNVKLMRNDKKGMRYKKDLRSRVSVLERLVRFRDERSFGDDDNKCKKNTKKIKDIRSKRSIDDQAFFVPNPHPSLRSIADDNKFKETKKKSKEIRSIDDQAFFYPKGHTNYYLNYRGIKSKNRSKSNQTLRQSHYLSNRMPVRHQYNTYEVNKPSREKTNFPIKTEKLLQKSTEKYDQMLERMTTTSSVRISENSTAGHCGEQCYDKNKNNVDKDTNNKDITKKLNGSKDEDYDFRMKRKSLIKLNKMKPKKYLYIRQNTPKIFDQQHFKNKNDIDKRDSNDDYIYDEIANGTNIFDAIFKNDISTSTTKDQVTAYYQIATTTNIVYSDVETFEADTADINVDDTKIRPFRTSTMRSFGFPTHARRMENYSSTTTKQPAPTITTTTTTTTKATPITTPPPTTTTTATPQPRTRATPALYDEGTADDEDNTWTPRRRMFESVHSSDLFISNKYVKVNLHPNTRKVSGLTLSNGVNISLDIQLYYYVSDEPEASSDRERQQYWPPGSRVFRPVDIMPVPIQDAHYDVKVYKNRIVEEYQCTFASWASLSLRLYADSPVVELDWLVGPVPHDDTFGKDVFIRYSTDLENGGMFYTDSNGRQAIKRIRDFRPTYMIPKKDPVAGNFYPVTSKITIVDTDRNIRLSVLNDRAQGGTSLNDGQIDLMLHRRIFTVDGLFILMNETEDGEGIRVRGKHYLYLTKDHHRANRIFEKKLAKEIELRPQIFVSKPFPYGNHSHATWEGRINEMSLLHRKLPVGIHLLTLEKWNDNTILVRLENYLEKSDCIKSGIKVVYLRDLFVNLRIKNVEETTLAANIWYKDFAPLQWRKKEQFASNFNQMYGNDSNVFGFATDDKPEWTGTDVLKEGVVLVPQQIRTFVCWFEYEYV